MPPAVLPGTPGHIFKACSHPLGGSIGGHYPPDKDSVLVQNTVCIIYRASHIEFRQ